MNWFLRYTVASYDNEWKTYIEQISRNNPRPFAAWFGGENRVYIPFQTPEAHLQERDEDVSEALQTYGYQITDYRKGICTKQVTVFPNGRDKPGVPKAVQYAIGKILPQLRSQEVKEAIQRHQQVKPQSSPTPVPQADPSQPQTPQPAPQTPAEPQINPQQELKDINTYWNGVIDKFNNSAHRVGSNNNAGFMIVISQDPHDIAQMSTGRGWESCMRLPVDGEEGGVHHSDVFCEVRSGGLVAYLVRANDSEVKEPFARIHIRRFSNNSGQSIAIPEKSVYGNPVKGFEQAVSQWISERQGDAKPGRYNREGGEYSDTFGTKRSLFVAPTQPEDIKQWLRGESPDAKSSEWKVRNWVENWKKENRRRNDDEVPGEDPEYQTFKTREEADQYVNNHPYSQDDYWREDLGDDEWTAQEEDDEGNLSYSQPAFDITEKKFDHTEDMRSEAVNRILDNPHRYDPETIQQVHDYIFNQIGTGTNELRDKFVKAFPNLVTANDLRRIPIKERISTIQKLPDGPEKERYQQAVMEDIRAIAMNPTTIQSWHEGNGKLDHRQVSNYTDEVLYPLRAFGRPIPEDITQALVGTANYWQDVLDGDQEQRKVLDRHDAAPALVRNISWALEDTKTDSPVVQDFFYRLLQHPWQPASIINQWGPVAKELARLGHPLPKHNNAISLQNVQAMLRALGPDNSKNLRPLIKQRLALWEKVYWTFAPNTKDNDSDLRAVNYTINSLKRIVDEITPKRTTAGNWFMKATQIQKSAQTKPHWHFAHPDSDGFLKLPVHYIRLGDIPTDQHGNPIPSMNGHRGIPEKGVSVYPAYFDPQTKRYIVSGGGEVFLTTQNSVAHRPAFLVEGQEIGTGYDDGEPLLDPKTVKVIKQLNKRDLVFEQDSHMTWDETHDLQDHEIPQFRPEDAALYPDNKPVLSPQQRAEKKRLKEEADQQRYEQKQKEHNQQLEAFRQLALTNPEYRELIYTRYPHLRNS